MLNISLIFSVHTPLEPSRLRYHRPSKKISKKKTNNDAKQRSHPSSSIIYTNN